MNSTPYQCHFKCILTYWQFRCSTAQVFYNQTVFFASNDVNQITQNVQLYRQRHVPRKLLHCIYEEYNCTWILHFKQVYTMITAFDTTALSNNQNNSIAKFQQLQIKTLLDYNRTLIWVSLGWNHAIECKL